MLLVVSHTGAPPVVHCAELVQPAWHVPRALHTGVEPLQSEFEAHCTHALFRQYGVDPEQSTSDSHCTHVCDVESQMARPVGQSELETQPTHAPVATSHMSPFWHMAPPSAVAHDARHVCVDG
jgi:hypothetical protein